jgi:hypothetical protein
MICLLRDGPAQPSTLGEESRYFSIGFGIEKILILIKIMQIQAELKCMVRCRRIADERAG